MSEDVEGLPTGLKVVVTELGETPLEGINQHVVIHEMKAPDPSYLAPHEAVIAIGSAAVGWVDLLMTSGQYQHMPRLPYTPGLEYAGDLVWLGSAADLTDIDLMWLYLACWAHARLGN